MKITITENLDFNIVKDFYSSCKKFKAPQPEDKVLVAKNEDGKIIGAVRLCNESGIFTLRTMEILPEFQRQGVGTLLLESFKNLLGENECYCIAFLKLSSFYSKIGFKEIDYKEAPVFLQERITDYRSRKENEGKKFILMKKSSIL